MTLKSSSDRVILLTLSDFFLVLSLIFFVLFTSVSHRLNRTKTNVAVLQKELDSSAKSLEEANKKISGTNQSSTKSSSVNINVVRNLESIKDKELGAGGSGPVFCKCFAKSCAPDIGGKGTTIAVIDLLDGGLRVKEILEANHLFLKNRIKAGVVYTPNYFRQKFAAVFNRSGSHCKFRAKKNEMFDSSRTYKEIRILEDAFEAVFYPSR